MHTHAHTHTHRIFPPSQPCNVDYHRISQVRVMVSCRNFVYMHECPLCCSAFFVFVDFDVVIISIGLLTFDFVVISALSCLALFCLHTVLSYLNTTLNLTLIPHI